MPVITKHLCSVKPKGSSVYFTSGQILPFCFSGQNCDPCTLNSLDLFYGTMCVQTHLNGFLQSLPNVAGTGPKFKHH